MSNSCASGYLYFHEMLERSDIQGSSGEYKAPRVPDTLTFAGIGVNGLVVNIQHLAHFYTACVFVLGYATYVELPSTPSFSRIRFSVPESQDEELRRKWIRRMKIVPTKLIF